MGLMRNAKNYTITVAEPERKTSIKGAGSRQEIFQGKLCK